MNKTFLTGIACASLLAAVATGCSEEAVLAGDEAGYVSLNLDFDPLPVKGRQSAPVSSRGEAYNVAKEDLTITLSRDDGALPPSSFTYAEFGERQTVVTGRYTIEAVYGKSGEEGWDMPYYYGSQQLTVKNQASTSVSMPVTLANAIVNVNLSDAFKEYMQDYSVTVTTAAGHDFVWADAESRQLYVNPGSVMVSVAFTKPNGKQATAQIEPFTAEARHRYNINIDVEIGTTETLQLTFDDTVADPKDVEVDISDANLPHLAAAPEILTEGFEAGGVINVVSGSAYDSALKATIVARGKIDTAVLNVKSDYLRAHGWPESIDLANPGASQSLLDAYGVKTIGLTGNKSVFAVVDFSRFVSKVLYVDGADNTSAFSLTVTDVQGKDKTIDLFSINVERLVLEILDGSEITSDGHATVKVHYNGASTSDVSLIAYNDRGTTDVLKVTSITPGATDGSYDFSLESSLITLNSNLRIYAVAGAERSADYTLRVPSLRLMDNEVNAFAKSAYASVILTNDEAAARKADVRFEVSTDGGNTYSDVTSEVASSTYSARGSRAGESAAVYKLSGLAPATTYMFRAKLDDEYSSSATLTTEEATQLPNSGMEEWYSEQRGDYQTWWFAATSKTSVWCTMNEKTTSTYGSGSSMFSYGGTAYRATSGTIPANANIAKNPSATANPGNQHAGENAALIRTVGWGSGNTSFGYSGKCENITAGELFLGSTDVSYNAIRGMAFGSRPASISFYCKYIPYKEGNGDYGVAEIKIKDNNGNIIAEASQNIESMSDYTLVTLPLSYSHTSLKPSSIEVNFYSSGNSACLTFNKSYISDAGSANYTNREYVGAKLYIDDIVLNY